MVCEDQVETELPAAPERPHSRHGSERPLRQSGFLNGEKLKRAVEARALTEGFAVMRVAAADAIPRAPERLEAWLAHGYQGEMDWMAERQAQRADPRQLWSEVRSVVMLAMN